MDEREVVEDEEAVEVVEKAKGEKEEQVVEDEGAVEVLEEAKDENVEEMEAEQVEVNEGEEVEGEEVAESGPTTNVKVDLISNVTASWNTAYEGGWLSTSSDDESGHGAPEAEEEEEEGKVEEEEWAVAAEDGEEAEKDDEGTEGGPTADVRAYLDWLSNSSDDESGHEPSSPRPIDEFRTSSIDQHEIAVIEAVIDAINGGELVRDVHCDIGFLIPLLIQTGHLHPPNTATYIARLLRRDPGAEALKSKVSSHLVLAFDPSLSGDVVTSSLRDYLVDPTCTM